MSRWIAFLLVFSAPVMWSLPIFFGYSADTDEHETSRVFLGWIRSDDFHRYGSFIDQTRYENRLVYWDYSAVEPQSPRIIAIYFFILGMLGKVLCLSAEHLWLISMYVVGGLFVLLLRKFILQWENDRSFALIASLLVVFSGGFEVFAKFAGVNFPRQKNYWMDGFSTFCSFHNPLKIAGIMLVMIILMTWRSYLESGKKRYLVGTGLLVICVWAVHPNSAIPGYIALLASALVNPRTKENRWFSWDRWKRLVPLAGPILVIIFYIVWMRTDETTANIIKQYQIKFMVEPFRNYPLRYGWILPLGVIGLFSSWKNRNITTTMLIGWWFGAELFAHFSGMSGLLFQHMIHPPMALFAAVALRKITSSSKSAGWVCSSILIITFTVQNVVILSTVIHQTQNDVWPTSLYWTKGEKLAAEAFRSRASGNVLVSRDSGNKVGWLSLHPVLLGHWGTTPQRGKKEKELQQFFNPNTPLAWRMKLLRDYRIRYIWYGFREKAMGPIDSRIPMVKIIDNSDVSIYRLIEGDSNSPGSIP